MYQATTAFSTTVREFFIERYKPQRLLNKSPRSAAEHLTTLNRWQAFLGREPLVGELADEPVATFLDSVAGQRSPATAEKHRRNLAALARFAAHRKRGLLEEPLDIPKIVCPETEPLAWSEDELDRLLAQAATLDGEICGVPRGAWWEALLVLLYYCGSRIDATMRLTWSDVRLDQGLILFRAVTQKQKKDQVLAFPPFAAERLAAIETPQRALVFPWPYDQRPESWQTLRRHLTKYILRPAGLPTDRKSKFHRIRKTTATVLTNWVSEDAAVQVLGHSSPAVTRKNYIQRSKVRAPRPCDAMPTPGYRKALDKQLDLF